MKKAVVDLDPGDRVTLQLDCLVRVVSVSVNPRAGEVGQPTHLLEFDPIGMIHDGTGQTMKIGRLVEVEVLDVDG